MLSASVLYSWTCTSERTSAAPRIRPRRWKTSPTRAMQGDICVPVPSLAESHDLHPTGVPVVRKRGCLPVLRFPV